MKSQPFRTIVIALACSFFCLEMTAFLITGDAARNKVQTMPGGGYATVKIELPRAWDKLMAELGYQPLKEYYID